MLSDKQKRFIQTIIIMLGVILGSIYLSPMLNSSKASGLLGGFMGFLISIAIFPETVKDLFEEQNEKRAERIMDEHKLGFYRYLTHPTQIPLTLTMLLFIFMIVLAILFNFLEIQVNTVIFQIGLVCMSFLWGLSGLLMLTRKEYIDSRGRRFRGWWAILNGIFFLLFGWGLLLFLIIAKIFNW